MNASSFLAPRSINACLLALALAGCGGTTEPTETKSSEEAGAKCPTFASPNESCTTPGQRCTWGNTSAPNPCPPGQMWGFNQGECKDGKWAITSFDGRCPNVDAGQDAEAPCPSFALPNESCTTPGQRCTWGNMSPPDPCPPGQMWGFNQGECKDGKWAVTSFDGRCPSIDGGQEGGTSCPASPSESCTTPGQRCTWGNTSPPDPCPPGQAWGFDEGECKDGKWAITSFDNLCPTVDAGQKVM